MADIVIHPTRKWLRFQYTTLFFVFCFAVFLYNNYWQAQPLWLLLIPALLFLYPLLGSLRRRFTKMTISGDKLRYECGIYSKTTRTIQISKIQETTVNQSLTQRLVGIGNLSIDMAGEASPLVIPNIDEPRLVADELQGARKGDRG
ncbi:MAG: PH domain-containing protein [Bryobacteraceae bacterium]